MAPGIHIPKKRALTLVILMETGREKDEEKNAENRMEIPAPHTLVYETTRRRGDTGYQIPDSERLSGSVWTADHAVLIFFPPFSLILIMKDQPSGVSMKERKLKCRSSLKIHPGVALSADASTRRLFVKILLWSDAHITAGFIR